MYVNPLLFTKGNEKYLIDTILHEYAHALCTYNDKHNDIWKAKYEALYSNDFDNIMEIIKSIEE
jgi:predicted SprT family Zn-dependent metalloprotease